MADEAKRTIEQAMTSHAQNDMAAAPRMWVDPPEPPAQKIGAEHLMAMLKLGAHELTAALQAFPDSNIRPMEEPGVFGNETMPHYRPDRDEGLDR